MQTIICHALCEAEIMSIYHCSIKAVSRSHGRSATAAAAYRDGGRIVDARTGEIHDYRNKQGVDHTEIVLPQGVTPITREQLWNAAEAAEVRKNSTVAREYELALPDELNQGQRQALVIDFARHLADRYGVAAGVAIHAPGRGGDHRNHHAHILTTTRQIGPDGELGAKTRSLDDRRSGEVERIRATWAQMVNQSLEKAGYTERVSHESLERQGIDRQPTIHLGPTVTAMERRGVSTDRGQLARELIREPNKLSRQPDEKFQAVPTRQAKESAAELVEAEMYKVMAKVAQYRTEKEMAARAEAERVMKQEQEKKAELQKEKQGVEKGRSRNRGHGMGR